MSFRNAKNQFESQAHSLQRALDALGASMHVDTEESQQFRTELTRKLADLPGARRQPEALLLMQRTMAAQRSPLKDSSFVDGGDAGQVPSSREIRFNQVGALKRFLSDNPRNALARVDLARGYFALDEHELASRQMSMALALAPDARFVVRSAARLHVDLDNEREAARALQNANGLRDDPWLLSVAVAIEARIPRLSSRSAVAVLESRTILPWHTGELAAALADREFQSGNRRRSRRFFDWALRDPTENVLAHAVWAKRDGPRSVQATPPGSFEAVARRHAERFEWLEAIEPAWAWLASEPFSEEAAVCGGLYAIEAEDYRTAIDMIDYGLIANPDNTTLLNNSAFAKACVWDLTEAAKDLLKIDLKAADPGALGCGLATGGLILFRSGQEDLGRRLYRRSIELFRKRKDFESAARAAINMAAEDLRVDSQHAAYSVAEAEKLVESAHDPRQRLAWAKVLQAGGLAVDHSPVDGCIHSSELLRKLESLDEDLEP